MKFLVLLAQAHEEFRLAELEAICELENIETDFANYSNDSPYLEIELQSEDEARRLAKRSFLIRSIYRLYAHGDTYEELHAANKQETRPELENVSFKFDFMCFQGSRSKQDQLQIINDFTYMDLKGPIRMKNPDVVLMMIEHYELMAQVPKHVWFTKFITDSDRHQIDVYNLKKRPAIGTTSFDAEMAFVTCNIAKIKANDFVYDPFSGTGSFPIAAAYRKALVFASDIDIRALRGYNKNFDFYKTQRQFMDVAAMDFTHNTLRKGVKLDAIVSDPPYGVREIIKVCGSRHPEKFEGKETVLIDNIPAHLRRDYIHPKKPYPLDALLNDLLSFAAERLVTGGRLAFWMPLSNDNPMAAPQHRHLRYVAACPQVFNKWTRWLVVYERRPEGEEGEDRSASNGRFRERYFTKGPRPQKGSSAKAQSPSESSQASE